MDRVLKDKFEDSEEQEKIIKNYEQSLKKIS